MPFGKLRRLFITPFGGAVLVIAVIMLIRSLLNRNSYEIIISCAALLLLLLLFIIGVWKSKKTKSLEPAWKPPFPMTANFGEDAQMTQYTQITGLDTAVPLFFRLHFLIKGKFFPCGSNFSAESKSGFAAVSVETSIPRNDTASQLIFNFPVSGIFHGEGFCRLRDIFGFFSFPCGQAQQRTVNVRSAPCFGKKTHINAQSGAEDRRNKPASDIERYHMREYTPGDRFRDINWKNSDKFDTLITRISTDNQEKVSRIDVYFRNYTSAKTVIKVMKDSGGKRSTVVKQEYSLLQLWLLDRTKARLAYFLRSLMEQNPSFIFDVHTAGGSYEIEDQDDLDAFLEELAGFSFFPPQHEMEIQAGKGDIYVFSTAFDFLLPSFLLACNPRPVTLFIAQPSVNSDNNQRGTEILSINDFLSNGCIVPPDWFKRGKLKPLGVRAEKTEMFCAEVKL